MEPGLFMAMTPFRLDEGRDLEHYGTAINDNSHAREPSNDGNRLSGLGTCPPQF